MVIQTLNKQENDNIPKTKSKVERQKCAHLKSLFKCVISVFYSIWLKVKSEEMRFVVIGIFCLCHFLGNNENTFLLMNSETLCWVLLVTSGLFVLSSDRLFTVKSSLAERESDGKILGSDTNVHVCTPQLTVFNTQKEIGGRLWTRQALKKPVDRAALPVSTFWTGQTDNGLEGTPIISNIPEKTSERIVYSWDCERSIDTILYCSNQNLA